jgi:hypothetical protein
MGAVYLPPGCAKFTTLGKMWWKRSKPRNAVTDNGTKDKKNVEQEFTHTPKSSYRFGGIGVDGVRLQ